MKKLILASALLVGVLAVSVLSNVPAESAWIPAHHSIIEPAWIPAHH
ncbi:hypothetical protein AB1L05_02700 [Cytobacillus horneckiae]